ncbi:hypothetical protein KEH51_27020 [[Brevibacterium] frigoritolerans]|uniref:Replicative helicase loading/DNA remodeling protein DnaB N-terminal winged helix domain-containing protein n=1 Tax=Peribacillus frigoritolerans TaxID=450367 RepID=A0A941FK52_9BACI|nr:hypothetical protein [Peribacillus frigoritolerans]
MIMIGKYLPDYINLLLDLSALAYMTLWSELEENRLWSETSSHYQLMNTIGLKLGDIYEARLLLEGIGLLNVYKKSKNETKEFIYELNPPLSPSSFSRMEC